MAAETKTADDDSITLESNRGTKSSNSLQELGLEFDVSDFTLTDSATTLLADVEFMDQSDGMGSWHDYPFNFSTNTSTTPWNDLPELEDIDFSSCIKTSPTESSLVTTESAGCSCFVHAVSTHEAIEVAVWGQKELSSDADEILQHLKKALVECEELLGCERCSTQPAYVMLVLSMCNKILGTLEAISQSVSMEGFDKTQIVEQASEKRRRNGTDGSNGDEGRRRGHSISIRTWQLDDDDEHLVLQSLLTARVMRMESLLSQLGKMVDKHSWPAHKGLIREMQNRLAGGPFDVYPRGRARVSILY